MFIQDINMMPPDVVERERDLALQEHRNYFIFPHRLADGEVRTVEVHSSPIERNGELLLFSIIHDITDRILAESRLAEISELNQQIIANSPVGIAIYQEDGQCIVVNDAIGQIIGGTKEQALSQNFRQLKSWQDTGIIDMAMKTLNTGLPTSETIHMVSSFEKTLWLSGCFNRFYLRNEPHLLLMFNDVTDVKETELKLVELSETLEERVAERSAELMAVNRQFLSEIREHAGTSSSLRDSEKRMTVAIESSPIGIFMIQDEKYTFSNQAFMKIFGLTNSLDLIGKQPETPYGDDSGKRFSDAVRQCVYRSEMINVNGFKVLTRDERERHLNIWLQPVEFWGSPTVMGFIIDVSEEIELRSHLNQSQKMEALGSLAGGIAHDFNNVLFAITGYTELALGSVPSDSRAKRQLEQVLAAGQRASNLVKHILTFSREREQEKQPLLIGPILKESLSFLRASITRNIEIRRDISADLHSVNADPTQIHQIIMNLLTNAYHAMKNTGGVLDVNLEEVDLTTDFVKTRPGMVPGIYQRLTVSDTGHGMTQETLERIFDPYFTTKQPGQGTGLGLSVADAIVRDHGGTITVKSVPDSGTKFEVYFPIIMDKTISSEETEQVTPLGNGRILFVDDEAMVTEATKSNLEDFGYEVVAENDPVIALAKFEAQPYSFDLIITDMSMPKMTGLELSMKISKIRSDIPIILITGFSDLIAEKDLPDYGIRKLIYKPVRNAVLAQTISKILTKQDLTGGTDGEHSGN
jgi:PAS domain S-box-containing protein